MLVHSQTTRMFVCATLFTRTEVQELVRIRSLKRARSAWFTPFWVSGKTTSEPSLRLVQVSSRWYLDAQEGPYAFYPLSLRSFPVDCCLWIGSSVGLIDDGPFLSFSRYIIYDVMFLAFCPRVVSHAPQRLRLFQTQASCGSCFACQTICFPFTAWVNLWLEAGPAVGIPNLQNRRKKNSWSATALVAIGYSGRWN